jgi:hypothetical protein
MRIGLGDTTRLCATFTFGQNVYAQGREHVYAQALSPVSPAAEEAFQRFTLRFNSMNGLTRGLIP